MVRYKRTLHITVIIYTHFINHIIEERGAMPETTSYLTPRFAEALQLAYSLHHNQMRKGTGTPYMAHLLSVCSLVMYHGGDEDQAIAALLHDSLEDAPDKITHEQIAEEFGSKVQEIVQTCSDTPPDFRGGEKEPWRVRKERYLAHIKSSDASSEFLLVSVADKVDNARAIVRDLKLVGDLVWTRFKVGNGDQLWYYRELVSAFRTAKVEGPLIDSLEELVRKMYALSGVLYPEQ